MKILLTGDQHRTNRRPRNRVDDYYRQLLRKTDSIFQLAINNSCCAILFPGDVFDTYKTPYTVIRDFINITRKYEEHFLSGFECLYTFGQHDVQYHTTRIDNTPLGVLLAGTHGRLLGAEPHQIENAFFYGSGWGEPTPEPTRLEGYVNILVTHRMVIGGKTLWEGQEDYTTANDLLSNTDWDLWCCGDNHQRVIMSNVHRRHVVNLGSLMRSTTAQYDHVPAVCIYDTNSKEITLVDIPCDPSDDVFCKEEVTNVKEQDERIQAFVDSLASVDTQTTDFKSALHAYMMNNDLPREVVCAICNITNMENVYGN